MFRIFGAIIAVCSAAPSFAADGNQFEAKNCLFHAASMLPNIPGLKIVDTSVAFDHRLDMRPFAYPSNFYTGKIVVEFARQRAVYSFSCPYSTPDKDSKLPPGIVQKGVKFWMSE